MKEKIIAWMKTRRYNSYILYLVVGGYLLYQAWMIVRDVGQAQGSPAPLYIAAALFFAVGPILAGGSLYAMSKGYFAERVAAEKQEEQESGDGQ